ncbi:regulator of G protein signaling 3 [Echinococcus multilocularis]|uniref:Regulator of G protein signaling 3 n=1 Tax=Echinococcus multilocularis TaxID=6211 RepID=A0A068Y0A2_ECHMU|nr:regulator of G protein signaling 3 [Echinococcus multilocularis]
MYQTSDYVPPTCEYADPSSSSFEVTQQQQQQPPQQYQQQIVLLETNDLEAVDLDAVRKINDRMVPSNPKAPVNLDCETRLQTELRLSQAEPDLFDASQKRIEALMEKDPYRRFLRSTLYLKLVGFCQKQEGSNSTPTDSKTVEPPFALPKPSNSASVH